MKPSRPAIIKTLHRLAEDTGPCYLDQINEDPKGNYYRTTRKKSDQQTVRRSEC